MRGGLVLAPRLLVRYGRAVPAAGAGPDEAASLARRESRRARSRSASSTRRRCAAYRSAYAGDVRDMVSMAAASALMAERSRWKRASSSAALSASGFGVPASCVPLAARPGGTAAVVPPAPAALGRVSPPQDAARAAQATSRSASRGSVRAP